MKKLLFLLVAFCAMPSLAISQYCTTGLYSSGCGLGDDIDYITLGSYTQMPTGCSAGDYADYTTDTIELEQAVTYQLSTATNYSADEYMGAWIDKNSDGDFDDAGEFVASVTTPFGFGNPSIANLTVGNLALGTYRFRVRHVWDLQVTASMSCSLESYGEVHDYTIKVLPPPPCPAPFFLTATAITDNSADLGWSASGASSFTLIYGTSGFNPATSGTVVNNANSPYSVSGLSAVTDYDFYVIADCGANGVSDTSFAYTFSTICAASVAGYFTDFDSDNLYEPPVCWNQYSTGSGVAEVETNRPALSGSQHLQLYNSFSAPSDTTAAITTRFSDMGAGDKQITFWANTSSAANVLYVGTTSQPNGGTFTTLDTINFSGTNTYEEFIIPITTANGYNGTDEFIYLMHGNGSTFSYIDVDDFTYELIPPCPKITGIFLVNATDTSATIGFSSSGTKFMAEWGPVGFMQGTGDVGNFTSNPFTINGLAPMQTYDVYILNDCSDSGNGFSSYTGPFTFSTVCVTGVMPFYESFDSWPPSCWDTTGGQNNWAPYAGPAGDNYVEANFWSVSSGHYLLTSLPVYVNQAAQVRVQWSHLGSSSYPDDGLIIRSTIAGSGVWDTILSLESSAGNFNDPTAGNTTPGNFIQEILPLPLHYVGNDVQVELRAVTGFGPDLFINNFHIEAVPACVPTTLANIHLGAISSDSAYFYWTPGDGVAWEGEIGNPGFTPGTGTSIYTASSNDTTMSLGGLMPNTTYEFYLVDSCAGGSLSPYAGPFTFTTKCSPVVMPYYESLDNWPISCWDSTAGSLNWEKYTGTGGDNHAMADFWNNSSGNFILSSPPVTITQDAQLRFYWSHLYSASYPDDQLLVRVKVAGTFTWDTILSLTGPSAFNDATAGNTTPGNFVEEEILLDPTIYTGNDILIEFIGITDWGPSLFLNDIYVENAPTCPAMINVTATNLLDTTATLQWVGGSGATSYQVWFGPQGFFQGTQTTGANYISTTVNSLILDTLSPSTCYEYLVRAICAPGDTSDWSNVYSFCTPCPITQAPYLETFNLWPPNCWAVDLGATDWQSAVGTSGDNYAMADFWGFNNTTFTMRSPQIYLNTVSLLRFDWSHLYSASYPNDQLIVRIRDVASGVWDTLYNFTGPAFNDPTASNTSPGSFITEDSVLSASYVGQVVEVEFIAVSGFGPILFINDFYLGKVPTCFEPTSITSSNIQTTSATVSWTGGGATNWQLLYGTQGFVPGSGAGTMIASGSNSTNLTGLSASTIYDVYVRDSCGVGDVSFWSGPHTFMTACGAINAPYLEQFIGSTIPNCYSTVNPTGTGIWINTSTNWPNYGAQNQINYPGSSGFAMGVDGSGNYTDTAVIMVTGDIDVSNLSTPVLSFYKFQNNINTSMNMTLYIDVFDGSNWNNGLLMHNTNDTSWVPLTINLNSLTITGPIRIRFRVDKSTGGIDAYYSDIIVDDIFITDAGCTAPDSLRVANLNCQGTDLVWSTVNSGPSIIEYGPAGFSPGTGAGIITFGQSPLNITGLSLGTDYDFYVADTCATDTSSVAGPFSFTTPTGPLSADFSTNTLNITPFMVDMAFDASLSVGATSYTWDFGDGSPQATGMNTTHSFTANGTYDVTLTIVGPCGTDSIVKPVLIVTNLHESVLSRSMEIYPNPTSGRVSISFETGVSGNVLVEVTDLSGRRVYHELLKDVSQQYKGEIDLTKLSRGTYLLSVKTEDAQVMRRIVRN